MSTERPLKEGNVRTYQEKVGLGYVDILANEMDGDLDTIYTAWNGGIGTPNLVDGSVTSDKLADEAKPWMDSAGFLTPTFPPRKVSLDAALEIRPQMAFSATDDSANIYGDLTVNNGAAGVAAVATAARMMLRMYVSRAGASILQVFHAVAGVGAPVWAEQLALHTATGDLTVTGRVKKRGYMGGIYGAAQTLATGFTAELVMDTLWYDTGNATAIAFNQVWAPYTGIALLALRVDANPSGGGLGCLYQIQTFNGTSWDTIASLSTSSNATAQILTTVAYLNAGQQVRGFWTNASGGPVTATWKTLSVAMLGQV